MRQIAECIYDHARRELAGHNDSNGRPTIGEIETALLGVLPAGFNDATNLCRSFPLFLEDVAMLEENLQCTISKQSLTPNTWACCTWCFFCGETKSNPCCCRGFDRRYVTMVTAWRGKGPSKHKGIFDQLSEVGKLIQADARRQFASPESLSGSLSSHLLAALPPPPPPTQFFQQARREATEAHSSLPLPTTAVQPITLRSNYLALRDMDEESSRVLRENYFREAPPPLFIPEVSSTRLVGRKDATVSDRLETHLNSGPRPSFGERLEYARSHHFDPHMDGSFAALLDLLDNYDDCATSVCLERVAKIVLNMVNKITTVGLSSIIPVQTNRDGDPRVVGMSEWRAAASTRRTRLILNRRFLLMVIRVRLIGWHDVQAALNHWKSSEQLDDPREKFPRQSKARSALTVALYKMCMDETGEFWNLVRKRMAYSLDKDASTGLAGDDSDDDHDADDVNEQICDENGIAAVQVKLTPWSYFKKWSASILHLFKTSLVHHLASKTSAIPSTVLPNADAPTDFIATFEKKLTLPAIGFDLSFVNQRASQGITVSQYRWHGERSTAGHEITYRQGVHAVTFKDYYAAGIRGKEMMYEAMTACFHFPCDGDAAVTSLRRTIDELVVVCDVGNKNPRLDSSTAEFTNLRNFALAKLLEHGQVFVERVLRVLTLLTGCTYFHGSGTIRTTDFPQFRRAFIEMDYHKSGSARVTRDGNMFMYDVNGISCLAWNYVIAKISGPGMTILPGWLSRALLVFLDILRPLLLTHWLPQKIREASRRDVLPAELELLSHFLEQQLNQEIFTAFPTWPLRDGDNQASITSLLSQPHRWHEFLMTFTSVEPWLDQTVSSWLELAHPPVCMLALRQLIVNLKDSYSSILKWFLAEMCPIDASQIQDLIDSANSVAAPLTEGDARTAGHSLRTQQSSYQAFGRIGTQSIGDFQESEAHRRKVRASMLLFGDIPQSGVAIPRSFGQRRSIWARMNTEVTEEQTPAEWLLKGIESALHLSPGTGSFIGDQEKGMMEILTTRNHVFLMNTCGSGKTLTFSLPLSAAGNGQIVIIIAPFVTLTANHREELTKYGFNVEVYDSTQPQFQAGCYLAADRSSKVEGTTFILMTPEAASTPNGRSFIIASRANGFLETIVVDEGHHIFTSSDFRYAWLALADFARFHIRFIVVSGTFPAPFRASFGRLFHIDEREMSIIGEQRPVDWKRKRIVSMLEFKSGIEALKKAQGRMLLVQGVSEGIREELSSRRAGDRRPILVLTPSRELADELRRSCQARLEEEMKLENLKFVTVHSEIEREERLKIVQRLKMKNGYGNDTPIIFGTSQLADGVDIPGLTLVIIVFGLYNGQLSIEQALARIGRGLGMLGFDLPHGIVIFANGFTEVFGRSRREAEQALRSMFLADELSVIDSLVAMNSIDRLPSMCQEMQCHSLAMESCFGQGACIKSPASRRCEKCFGCVPSGFKFRNMARILAQEVEPSKKARVELRDIDSAETGRLENELSDPRAKELVPKVDPVKLERGVRSGALQKLLNIFRARGQVCFFCDVNGFHNPNDCEWLKRFREGLPGGQKQTCRNCFNRGHFYQTLTQATPGKKPEEIAKLDIVQACLHVVIGTSQYQALKPCQYCFLSHGSYPQCPFGGSKNVTKGLILYVLHNARRRAEILKRIGYSGPDEHRRFVPWLLYEGLHGVNYMCDVVLFALDELGKEKGTEWCPRSTNS